MISRKLTAGRIVLTFALCALVAVSQIQAAVTIDFRSSNGAASNTGLGSLTWSHTIGNGANRALLVGVATATTSLASLPANRVTSVTYNGTNLTRIGTIVSANTLNSSELFVLVNPPVGTANVVVNFGLNGTPSLFVNQAVGNSISFFGVSQTAPNGAFASATGTNVAPTLNVTDSLIGDFVFDTLAASPSAGFFVEGANQTVCTDPNTEATCNRGRSFFGNAYDVGASSTEAGASPTVTMSWTIGTADNWALGAVAVKQSVTTSATVLVGGRVFSSPNGRGLARARLFHNVERRDPHDFDEFVRLYRFKDVATGETYIFNVSAKNRSFSSQVVSVNDELTGLNFYPQQ